MGNEQGALEGAQNRFNELSTPGPQGPLETPAQSGATVGTGEESTDVKKEGYTSFPINSPRDIANIETDQTKFNKPSTRPLVEDDVVRKICREDDKYAVDTVAPSSLITEGPHKKKEMGPTEGTEDGKSIASDNGGNIERKTKSMMEVSAPLFTDPRGSDGAGPEESSPSCVVSPDNRTAPVGDVNRNDKEQKGNEKLDTSSGHNDHITHGGNHLHFRPTGQTVYPLPALLHVWKKTNCYSGRDRKVALRNCVSHTEDCRGENEEDRTPLTGWRLCERVAYCESSPPSARRGTADTSPITACGSPAGQFQHRILTSIAALGVPPMERPGLSPTRSATVPPPPPLSCHQPLRDGSSPLRGQSSPVFDASSPPVHTTSAETETGTPSSVEDTAPRRTRLNPLAPVFEPHQNFQQLQLLQHLRAATTVSGASTTCSLRSTQGAPSLLTSIVLRDTRAPVGRTVSYVFPQRHSSSPILRCSSTGPSVAQHRPLLVPHPPLSISRMGGLGAAKRGMTSSAQQASAPPRYPTMPRHSWYGPHSPGGTAWWLGVGRSGAPGTSRGLEGRLAEVVDPAEANKLLLQLGRQVRLTHLQVQAVVKKAGPSGLRLTNLPAAFLKEHNAVLDLRSLGLLQIRELIAGMGRTLLLEADDEDPLTLQEAAAGTTGATCRAAHPEKRPPSLQPVVAAVAGLAAGPTEETTGNMQELPSQKAQPGGGVHEHPGLQGGTNVRTDLTTSLHTPRFFALDEESCLVLKLGEPLPPVMKELLQHLLISLVADALHHASPPTFAASPTSWSLATPHAGLLKPPTPPGSLVTATSPEALSPEACLHSESPEVRAPSLKPRSAGNSPDPACSPSPTENMRVMPQTKESERHTGVKAKPGAPGFAEGTGNTKFGSPSYGKKNKGIPIHILPALWQLKYGLRCNLSAMLEKCGYTSLRAFILDELPSLHISPAGSQVTLRLTPTSPRSLAPEALATLGVAAEGKQVLQNDSKAALQTAGSAPPAQPKKALSLSRVIDVVTEGRDKQPLISIKELISKSPLDTNGASHPTIEAIATAAAAAVQASGVSLPTLLAALSSVARYQAGRGADPGPPTEGETKCGGRPHILGFVRPTGAASKPRASPGEAPLAGPSGDKEGAWPLVEGSAKSHRPSPVTMETILCNSVYSKQVANKATFEEYLSSEGLRHSSPNAIQETSPPESASRLLACKERPPDTCLLVARPQSQDVACVNIGSDKGVATQKPPAPNKKHKNKQSPALPPKCGQVSRLHLHRMLHEAIAMGCEKRGRRWARGEDLIELEEELQQHAAAALRGKEIASSKLRGGQGRSSPSVSDEPNAAAKPEQTKEPSSDLGFSSALPSAPESQKGGEKGGRLEFFSPRATLQTGDRKNGGDNSTEEDTLEETEHNGTGYTPSSAAVKGDETDEEEKKTETEAGESTPEAHEEAELDDARLQRRRMKKREKKEKKKRKKERLRALDEHEQEQKRLLSLVDLLQLPPSPSSAPPFSPETPSPFSLAGDEETSISPFSLASPSRGQTHSCDTATEPSISNQLLGSCEQSSTTLRNETTKIVPVLHADGTSDAAACASLAVSRFAGESISLATPPRRPISQLRLSLSPEELATELQNYHNRAVGMLVSAIKIEWERHFGPQTPSLQAYMDHFQVRQLKALLLEVPNLLILGCGGKMRVSTLEHAMQFCNPFPPPSTVFISPSGKKINLPLTMTPTSPLPWFRAHAYTRGIGSGCASALPHLKQLTVPDVTAVRPSQGGACEGGEMHDEREHGYRKQHGGRHREARLRDDKARGDEGQRGTGSAPVGTDKRGKAQCGSLPKRIHSGDTNGAVLRQVRERDREQDNPTAISPSFASRPGPPQHAVNSVEALPLSPHWKRAPSQRLGPGSGGDRSPSFPLLVTQSASHHRRLDDMAEGQHVGPRQPGSTSVWDNQAGPIRYGLVSQKAQPPHGPSLTTNAEPHRRMREEALGTLWKAAVAVQKQRGTGTFNPFSASESFYTVPPPGLNRSPPFPPPVQPLPPAMASHDSSPPSMLPRPPAEGDTLSNPWDSDMWSSPSPSQTEIQRRALDHSPKPLPPNTVTDLERLLVCLLLMDSATGNAAAVAGHGSAPKAPEEPAGYGPVSSLLPLLTHVRGVQQLHRASEDLQRQRERGSARENRDPKRKNETQRSLMPTVEARRQPPSFQAPCASTAPSPPTWEAFTPADPFLHPPKLFSFPQSSQELEHAEDKPENRAIPDNLPTYSEMHHLFPEPPGLAGPSTASPTTYGSHAMTRHMFLHENDCRSARDSLEYLNEEGGIAHGLQRLNLRSHMKPCLTLLENGQMHAATPGAWHQALPSSFGFSSTAFPSAAVSTHQVQSPGHLSLVAEAFGKGEKQYDKRGVLPQSRSMERETIRQPGETQRATPALSALGSQPSGAVRPPLLQTFFQADIATACPSCETGPAPSGALFGLRTGNREQQFFAEDEVMRKIPERPTHATGRDADSLMPQMSYRGDKATDTGGCWGVPSCLSVAPRRDLEHRERVYPGRGNLARAPNCMPHQPLERPVHKNTAGPCPAVDSSPYPPDSDSQGDRCLASSIGSSGEDTELGQEIRIGARMPGASSFERRQRKPQENSNGDWRIITRREGAQTRRAGNDIEVELNEHSEASLSRATRGREVGNTGENIKTGVSEVEWTQKSLDVHVEKGDAVMSHSRIRAAQGSSRNTEGKLAMPWTRLHPTRRTDSGLPRIHRRKDAPPRKAKALDMARKSGPSSAGRGTTHEEPAYSRSPCFSSSEPSHYAPSLSSPFSARVPVLGVQAINRRGRARTKSGVAEEDSSATRRQATISLEVCRGSVKRPVKSLPLPSQNALRPADAASTVKTRRVKGRHKTNTKECTSQDSPELREHETRTLNLERRNNIHRGRDKLRTSGGRKTVTPIQQHGGKCKESLLWCKKSSEEETSVAGHRMGSYHL